MVKKKEEKKLLSFEELTKRYKTQQGGLYNFQVCIKKEISQKHAFIEIVRMRGGYCEFRGKRSILQIPETFIPELFRKETGLVAQCCTEYFRQKKVNKK